MSSQNISCPFYHFFFYAMILLKAGDRMTVGENIKKIRKEKGLTQKELGEKLKISQAAIGQFESNASNLQIETIEKIAGALEVPVAHLLIGAWDKYKDAYEETNEAKEINRSVVAFYATIKLIESIYKRAESIDVNIYQNGELMSCSNYISIGEGQERIAIPNAVFDDIVELVKNNLISAVKIAGQKESEFLKDWESENDVDRVEIDEAEHIKIVVENTSNVSYSKPI